MSHSVHDFPLAALVGQEQLKSALLLCAVNPGIGGVVIRGDKGSAKSTAARGLAAVMAPIQRVLGCAYNCVPGQPAATCEVCNQPETSLETTAVPFVNLPLGASEDRVLGSLDFERALKEGRKAFQPGLLAAAHRGILYIDEVNLLPDHLVDVLLDAAAMGINRVQREGLSIQHPARIALVGTMNQEEGELRPQLLDRFGLMVEVLAPQEPRVRAEIVRRRLAWESDPAGFNREWDSQQSALRERVERAQALLPQVTVSDGLLLLISELCCSQGVTSLRADLVMNKAARALAALDRRTSVEPSDLAQAAMLVLPHRRRTKPFDRPGLDQGELERLIRQAAALPPGEQDSRAADSQGLDSGGSESCEAQSQNTDSRGSGSTDAQSEDEDSHSGEPGGGSPQHSSDGNDEREGGADSAPVEHVFAAGLFEAPPRIELESSSSGNGAVGRRTSSMESRRGRDVRATLDERPTELAITATLRHSILRTGGLSADGKPEVTQADLHQKVKAGRQGSLILFVVDASGSMAARHRMKLVKGAVVSLLHDAYQRRDEVGVIGFRGTEAELLLPPTRSVAMAEQQLNDLPTGGRTPLAHALQTAFELVSRPSGDSSPEPLLIVLTDGKANVPLDGRGNAWQQSLECAKALAKKRIAALVLDTEVGFVRMGRAQELAEALNAQCLSLEGFSAQTLSLTIRGRLHATSQRRTGHP